jgi:hypothetical protein
VVFWRTPVSSSLMTGRGFLRFCVMTNLSDRANVMISMIIAFVICVYRTRFFGHKFELSGLLHSGFLLGDTCVVGSRAEGVPGCWW